MPRRHASHCIHLGHLYRYPINPPQDDPWISPKNCRSLLKIAGFCRENIKNIRELCLTSWKTVFANNPILNHPEIPNVGTQLINISDTLQKFFLVILDYWMDGKNYTQLHTCSFSAAWHHINVHQLSRRQTP